MTLIQKEQYLLDNSYTLEGEGTNKVYYSKDRSKRFTLKDLLTCWNSMILF